MDEAFGKAVTCGGKEIRIEKQYCCGMPLTCDNKGVYVCFECGKVERDVWRSYATPMADFAGLGKRCTLNQPKRLSKPLHNFRRVLRQFFGNLPEREMAPAWLMNKVRTLQWLNIEDTECYAKMREWMRAKPSLRKYYKNIFELLYSCGGKQPYEAARHIPRLEAEYVAMCYHFEQTVCDKRGRTSMFNAWMVLDYLLDRFRCKSYYQLPMVKDRKANEKIHNFIESYKEFASKRGGIDLDEEFEKTGVWPVGLPCINYYNAIFTSSS